MTPDPTLSLRARFALGAAGAAAALCLAACGPATVNVTGRTIRLRLDEYRVLPQKISVQAGRLELVVTDTGILTHNLEIEEATKDSSGNPIVLAHTPVLFPGQTVRVQAPLPPGRYVMISTLSNQAALGMTGTLTAHG